MDYRSIRRFRSYGVFKYLPASSCAPCVSSFVRIARLYSLTAALPLRGDVENLAQVDVAPHLGPLRIQVARQRFPEGIRRLLIVVLQEVNPPRCGSAPANWCGWFPAPSGIPSAPRRIRSIPQTARRAGSPPPPAPARYSAARGCSGRSPRSSAYRGPGPEAKKASSEEPAGRDAFRMAAGDFGSAASALCVRRTCPSNRFALPVTPRRQGGSGIARPANISDGRFPSTWPHLPDLPLAKVIPAEH